MHQTILTEQRRAAFSGALARLQAKLPQITKAGRIQAKGGERRYAKIEDIDVAIRPLLAEEGFAFSFNEDATDGKNKVFSCELSHAEGHSVTKRLTLPIDSSPYRTDCQSVGSTTSYARRYLIKMHLNMVEAGEDDDGQGGAKPITQEQADTLRALRDEVKANGPKFLAFMGVPQVTDILARDYRKAVAALEAMRRA